MVRVVGLLFLASGTLALASNSTCGGCEGDMVSMLQVSNQVRTNNLNGASTANVGAVLDPPVLEQEALSETLRRARRLGALRKTYHPRRAPPMEAGEISLDFEVETGAHLQMTPRLLVERGGYKLSGSSPFPRVSEWFSVGLDGVGVGRRRFRQYSTDRMCQLGLRKCPYRQGLDALVELETRAMRPRDVARGLLPPLGAFLGELGHHRPPGTPLPHAKGVLFRGGKDLSKQCSGRGGGCPLQWTVGLELRRVPELLALGEHKQLSGVLLRAASICAVGDGGCAPEYLGLLILAANTLESVHSCYAKKGCTAPKRCVKPWLVRTHFGDLVSRARAMLGEEAIARLPEDVLAVWGKDADTPVLGGRFVDYLTLPEMAEVGGFVPSRDPSLAVDDAGYMEPMPEDEAGLLRLSQRMLDQRHTAQVRLMGQGCGVHGKNDEAANGFSAGEWLREMLKGRDLMSDSDSPISANSLGHLVWKSMGSWRMTDGDDRIYLECRHPRSCLGRNGTAGGLLNTIARIGSVMEDFER